MSERNDGEPQKKTVGRPFEKGEKNPRVTMPNRSGIQKGGKHHSTRIREAVLSAFEKAGGERYLLRIARSKKDRHLFTQLLAKAMPTEITGKDGGPIDVHVFHIAKAGLSKLSDERLQLFYDILCEIGVNDVVAEAANEADSIPLLPAPEEQRGTAAA